MTRDAFEKMTHKSEAWHDIQSMDSTEKWAAKLLRDQHSEFVRLVKRKLHAKDTRGNTGVEIHVGLDRDAIDHFNQGFEYACSDLLAALDRQKGTR